MPWAVADRAWAAYSAQYGREQSVERLAQRGGFGWGEMDMLFPGWRDATDQWKALAAERDALRVEVREANLALRSALIWEQMGDEPGQLKWAVSGVLDERTQLQTRVADLEKLLRWMDSIGGLGLNVHQRILDALRGGK